MIEWFLQPKTENERAISHAMKLYSANSVVDEGLKRFLDRDDKKLDRGLKQLQVRKLAQEQGLDWQKYMSDDAAEENRTAQGAIAYGAKVADKTKPIVSFSTHMTAAKASPSEFAEFVKTAKSGASNAFHAPSRFLSGLMADAKVGNMASNISKAFRFASFL